MDLPAYAEEKWTKCAYSFLTAVNLKCLLGKFALWALKKKKNQHISQKDKNEVDQTNKCYLGR